ncbi:MAG: sigma-70 family RNA polymerase sigma factor [Betaproteobacteria bacterium]|nr:sigma-70 family RNA polymerase sigma factor [Betaproteobacteria bacterium]MDH5221326.1 sigma-70 family RNA polymerase sigma factor [Betaproteobacteria bacterium]MDH5352130.1 sigma-70 family RNA polymerase sigma factor [Betaproteobacteria bacterium]
MEPARVDRKTEFSRQIREHMDALYSFALRLTRHGADAEDLVAEATIRAWSAIDTLSDDGRFRSWMFRILHNCYVSDYRRKSVRPAELGYEELPAPDDEGDVASVLVRQPDAFLHWWANPEREVVNKLLGRDLQAAIQALPESFRVVVVLINVEGLSYDEAAEVLGVPAGTIRSRMNRGRTLLQKALWQHAQDAGLIADRPAMESSQ